MAGIESLFPRNCFNIFLIQIPINIFILITRFFISYLSTLRRIFRSCLHRIYSKLFLIPFVLFAFYTQTLIYLHLIHNEAMELYSTPSFSSCFLADLRKASISRLKLRHCFIYSTSIENSRMFVIV